MVEEREDSSIGALVAAAIDGLPNAISQSALGALNRLVAGVTDIPATYLAGVRERLEDKNYERRHLHRALVDAASIKAVASPEIVDRTLERLLVQETRKQVNREAVAIAAVDELKERCGSSDQSAEAGASEPDEEWLNVFERYAEEASTERMQKLWGGCLQAKFANMRSSP